MSDPLEELRSSHSTVAVAPEMIGRVRASLMDTIARSGNEALTATETTSPNHVTSPRSQEGFGAIDDIEWLDSSESELPAQSYRVLAAAAMLVLAALLGGLVFSLVRPGSDVQVATSPPPSEQEQAAADVPFFQPPAGPVRGLDEPVVTIDRESANGRECSAGLAGVSGSAADASINLFGTSPIAESYPLPAIPGNQGSTTFVDLGSVSLSCDGRGGFSFSAGAGEPSTVFGSPDEVPAIGGLDGRGDETGRIYLQGRADLDVVDVRIVSDRIEEQTFLRFGDRFQIDATEAFSLPTDQDEQFEIFFEDGSSQMQGPSQVDCLGNAQCVRSWFQFFIDAAIESGSSAQVAALEDFEVTQFEFDSAVDQFRACLPNVQPSIDNEVSGPIRDCFATHIGFLDEARILQNSAWMLMSGGVDEFFALMEELASISEAETSEAETATVTVPAATADEVIDELVQEYPQFVSASFQSHLDGLEVASRFLPPDLAELQLAQGFRTPYEGLLSPGAYEVSSETGHLELLQSMATRTEERLDLALAEAGGATPVLEGTPLSEYEVLIVASLVEGEANVEADRPRIARVIYNRLLIGESLGLDSTSCYAVQKPCSELTADDLNSDSPWNTRNPSSIGLPPTPITSPSAASLRAALQPADGDWLFYVLTNEDGSYSFASTADEHATNVELCRERSLGC